MSLNKLFTTKWNPKRWNNALNPMFKNFEEYKIKKAYWYLLKTKPFILNLKPLKVYFNP
ncbi:hypothetical protein ACQJ9Z_02320 [Helicobacter pylori]